MPGATSDDDDDDDDIVMDAMVPHAIDPSALRSLAEYATSFSAANGLQVALKDRDDGGSGGVVAGHVAAPISLLPQSYPRSQFDRAVALAGPFNVLVDRISRDGGFLRETLRDVRGLDEYTGKLLELYEEIYLGENKGTEWGRHARAADRLGIQRSDYMLHRSSKDSGDDDGYAIKQVELNTIASSFAGLASAVARLHAFSTERMGDELGEFLEENERAVMGGTTGTACGGDEGGSKGGVPRSPAMERIPSAVAAAYDRYRGRFPPAAVADPAPVALFVVQPGETNTVDQRMLEFALWDRHGIPVVRMSLADAHHGIALDESSGRLTIVRDGGKKTLEREVAVVYFRAGYAPTDYPSGYDTSAEDGAGVEWLARERLERGRAAKCPCLGYHLAGTKKVQQELAREGAVERFFPEGGGSAAEIRRAFAGLHSLGADANERDLAAVKEVLFRGGEGRYVLKPQREGGGYNYYGTDLADKLRENCTVVATEDGDDNVELSPALSEFILMERLFPPQQLAILMRGGRVEGTGMTVSELGCFGTIVATGEGGEVVHNEYAGFLLRTKFSGVDEGGVASGFATLSSPYLC